MPGLAKYGSSAAILLGVTEITHREPKLAGRRVEELYFLLEQNGDDALRDAIVHTVERGQLSVAGVRRCLLSSVRGRDGERHHVRAAQPRGLERDQLALALGRAERDGGAA